MTFDDITAVIVTRGNVPLAPILATLPYPRVIVWDDMERGSKGCYGRYLAAEEAETDVIYFQDDDLIFRGHEELLAAWEPEKLIVNMPSPWYESYAHLGQALVGAGSLCPKGFWREPFARYLSRYPEDDLFLTYCDFIFGQLAPHVRYDFGYEPFNYANAEGRIFSAPNAAARRRIAITRGRELRGIFDADWYDLVMVEDGSPAMEPIEVSPWLLSYSEVAKMIDNDEAVVDLGCGTGRFEELLFRRGHYGPIAGIDWSNASLREARSYVSGEVDWQWADLDAWMPSSDDISIVYVCLEVLEHMEHDRELVAKIPSGCRLLLSVPNFWDQSHVRVFEDFVDVRERYGDLLDFRRWVMAGRRIHVCETRRR